MILFAVMDIEYNFICIVFLYKVIQLYMCVCINFVFIQCWTFLTAIVFDVFLALIENINIYKM